MNNTVKSMHIAELNPEWLENDGFEVFRNRFEWASRTEPNIVIVLTIGDADEEDINTLPEDLKEIINNADTTFLSLYEM